MREHPSATLRSVLSGLGALAFTGALLLLLVGLSREPEVDVRRPPERIAVLRIPLPDPPPPPPAEDEPEPPADEELPEVELPPLSPPEPPPVEVAPTPMMPSLLPVMSLPAPRVARTGPANPRVEATDPEPTTDDRPTRPQGPLEADEIDGGFGELTGNPKPTYPRLAKRRELEGSVWVRILVDEDGRAVRWVILRVEGHASFGPAVERVLARYRFERPRHKGRPVQVWTRKTFVFETEG